MTRNSTSSELVAERARDTKICADLKQSLERSAELMTAAKNADIVVSFKFDRRMNGSVEEFFVGEFVVHKILRPEPTT